MISDQTIVLAAGMLQQASPPGSRVMLFGSYAKGTAHPGSDVDLLVVAELPGDTDAHMRRARQLTAGLFPPIDVVLCTPDDMAGASKARSPFLASVLGSGVTLYRRDPIAPEL